MPALVFLSHSSKDDTTVTRIHDEIEAATGEDVWVDHKDIKAADYWQESIDTALADCTHMLVMLSKDSVISREVTTEWRDALLRKKPLLPVVIDDLELTAIPARLRIIQPVNLKRDWDGGIKQLVDVIGRAHKGESIATDFGQWRVTGTIDRMLVNIPISGREAEIAKVQDDLKRAPTSILGVGGLGKSRLAAEIVLTQGETSGAVWHVCGERTTAEDVYELLREHLELEATTPAKEVLKRLRAERLLVVLDNAESISESDPRRKDYLKLVNDLFDTKPTQVLLTSRTEWTEIRLGRVLRLKEPQAAAAEQIVRDMAKVFDITDYKAEDYAAELAEAARYHPRLIEWAVGKLAIDDPKVVIRELRELKSEDIQEALDEMIQITIEQMKTQEREGEAAAQTLAKWVVCRGGFTREAAGYLQQAQERDVDAEAYVKAKEPMTLLDEDQLNRALKMLTRWQFVRRIVTEKEQTRYTIEPLVMAAMSADETAYLLHFEYYKALADQHDKRQDYAGLAPEADNLEAAFEWAMGVREYEKAYWFTGSTTFFLANRGRFEQRKNWLDRVANKLDGLDQDNRLIWAVQISLGNLYQEHPLGNRNENLRRAAAAYEEALKYRSADAAPLDYAMTQNNLGEAYRNLAQTEDREMNLKRAVVAFETALAYSTAKAASLDFAMTQNNLGAAYNDLSKIEDRQGNLNRAMAAFEASLAYRKIETAPLHYAGTQYNMAMLYESLAEVENREENLRTAVATYQSILHIFSFENDPLNYAKTQWGMATDYDALGETVTAIRCWQEAERAFRTLGLDNKADLMLELIAHAEKTITSVQDSYFRKLTRLVARKTGRQPPP